MAAKRRFYSANGQIFAQRDESGRKNYVTDGLGSVTGASTNGSISGAARYSPLGRTIAGASGTSLGWIGAQGYVPTARANASHFIGRRHYDSRLGRWTSLDPMWPIMPGYGYASNNPMTKTDPSGLLAVRFEFNAFIPRRLFVLFHGGRHWIPTGTLPPFRSPWDYANSDERDLKDKVRGSAKHWSYATIDSMDIGKPRPTGNPIVSEKFGYSIAGRFRNGGWQQRGPVIGHSGQRDRNQLYAWPEPPCVSKARFYIQACTAFLPLALQTEAFCINYDITVTFEALGDDRVIVNFTGTHDLFPDYEAWVWTAKEQYHIYRFETKYKTVLGGGLERQAARAGGGVGVEAPTDCGNPCA